MFGIDSSELAIIALVALLVIGPKDLPRLMRVVGQWMAKARGMTRHVRAGFDTMMREAELEDMKKQWAAQNEAIMKASALPDLGIREALPDLSADEWMSPRDSVNADMRGLHGADEAAPVPTESAASAVTESTAAAVPESTAAAASGNDTRAVAGQDEDRTAAAAKKPRRRKAADPTPTNGPDTAAAPPAKPIRKRTARIEPQTSDR